MAFAKFILHLKRFEHLFPVKHFHVVYLLMCYTDTDMSIVRVFKYLLLLIYCLSLLYICCYLFIVS